MDVIENPGFFISLVIGGIVLAGISSAYQMYNPENSGKVKPKAVLRDGLLGAIFVAMAWTFVPESMKSVTESVTSSVSTATTTVANTASSITSDFDVQVGPARF